MRVIVVLICAMWMSLFGCMHFFSLRDEIVTGGQAFGELVGKCVLSEF